MNYLSQSAGEAIRLLATLDPDVMSAVRASVQVAIGGTLTSGIVGLPIGYLLGSRDFRGRNTVMAVLQTLTAIPTVVIGLFAYILISNKGILGPLHLLYTIDGIVFGLFFLILPLVISLSMSATQSVPREIGETALTLGVSRLKSVGAALREGRFAYFTVLTMAFGRAVGEVGVAMMLGGNIRGVTRTMTTAIALETEMGEFAFSLALGFILLAIALLVNIVLYRFKSRMDRV